MTSSHQPAALPAEHLAGRGRLATAAVLKRLTDQEGGPPPQGPGAVHLLTASVCWSGSRGGAHPDPGPGTDAPEQAAAALVTPGDPSLLCRQPTALLRCACCGGVAVLTRSAVPCSTALLPVGSAFVARRQMRSARQGWAAGNVQVVGGPADRVAGHGEARTPCGGPVELLAQARTRPRGPTHSRDRHAGGGPAELLHPPGCRPRARRGGCCGDPYRRRPRRTAPAQPLPGGAAAGAGH